MGCSPGSPPSSPASFPERRLRRDLAGLGRSLPPPPAPRHFANRKDHAMTEMIKNFWKDEEGATAIEYGLIAGLIAVGIVVGATALGTDLNGLFNRLATKLNGLAQIGRASCRERV